MKKTYIDFNDAKNFKLISRSSSSFIYKMKNGNILKVFSPDLLKILKVIGDDKEAKVLNSHNIKNVPEIILPKEAIYLPNGEFIGYSMKTANGIDYNECEDKLTLKERCNLKLYRDEYLKLEDIIKRAHKDNIIMPDFCTFDNLFMDQNGNFQIIDFDGLQIDNYKSSVMSTSLGNPAQYNVPKYNNNGLYTENLDIKSLIIMYFLVAFNINLEKIGQELPDGSGKVTIDFIFEQINLYDYDLMHKIWKCYNDKVDNEYIGEDVIRIAEEYEMAAMPILLHEKMYFKRLIKK